MTVYFSNLHVEDPGGISKLSLCRTRKIPLYSLNLLPKLD